MEIIEKLQAPFPAKDIEWRVGVTTKDKKKGMALAYVTNRAIQNRLDEVFGPFGWKNEFKEWKGNAQICGISIWDNERQTWVTKWDGADDSNMEATKGGLSDAMKRAAYQWGIGRYLYNLEGVWVPIKRLGGSYRLASIPKLPDWALPQGDTSQAQQTPAPEPEKNTDPKRVALASLSSKLGDDVTGEMIAKVSKAVYGKSRSTDLTVDQIYELGQWVHEYRTLISVAVEKKVPESDIKDYMNSKYGVGQYHQLNLSQMIETKNAVEGEKVNAE